MTPPAAPLADPVSEAVPKTAILCHCLKVTRDQVQDVIELHGCETVEDVTACCGAGGGCTACHHRIRALLRNR